jgi:hypothetical protein
MLLIEAIAIPPMKLACRPIVLLLVLLMVAQSGFGSLLSWPCATATVGRSCCATSTGDAAPDRLAQASASMNAMHCSGGRNGNPVGIAALGCQMASSAPMSDSIEDARLATGAQVHGDTVAIAFHRASDELDRHRGQGTNGQFPLDRKRSPLPPRLVSLRI